MEFLNIVTDMLVQVILGEVNPGGRNKMVDIESEDGFKIS